MQINQQLDSYNDNDIFNLTGCLSMCKKYAYNVQQIETTQYRKAEDGNTTLTLALYYSNVEHELREQVMFQNL